MVGAFHLAIRVIYLMPGRLTISLSHMGAAPLSEGLDGVITNKRMSRGELRSSVLNLQLSIRSFSGQLNRPTLQPIGLLPEHKFVSAAQEEMRVHKLLLAAARRRA